MKSYGKKGLKSCISSHNNSIKSLNGTVIKKLHQKTFPSLNDQFLNDELQVTASKHIIGKFHSLSLTDKDQDLETLSNYSDYKDANSSQFCIDDDTTSLASYETFSVVSNNSFNSSDDSTLYHSSITHPTKRRKLDYPHVEDNSQNSLNESMASNLSNPDVFEPIILKKKNQSLNLWIFLVLLLLFYLFAQNIIIIHTFKNEKPFNLGHLEGNFTECLIGQEFAHTKLIETLSQFNSNNSDVLKLDLIWLVGPIGVGKSYTRHLIKSSFNLKFQAFSFLNSLLPPNKDIIKKDVETLFQSLDNFQTNLISIDGFDKSEYALEYLNLFFDQYKLENRSFKVLIIVSGTFKSEHITKFYAKHFANGETRETLNYTHLQLSLAEVSPFKSELLSSLSIIPFLPLEIDHIKKCVIQQLNFLLQNKSKCITKSDTFLEKAVESHNFTVEGIQNKVIHFFYKTGIDNTSKIISSGCKRIYSLVTAIWFDIPNSEFILNR